MAGLQATQSEPNTEVKKTHVRYLGALNFMLAPQNMFDPLLRKRFNRSRVAKGWAQPRSHLRATHMPAAE